MTRGKHPNKDIRAAVEHALKHGWRLKPAKGHGWGVLFCPENDPACRSGKFCIKSVWSTPRRPEEHARDIRKWVDDCIHMGDAKK
ncbi:hypothetical protein C882_2421 [Caenispirillum salinarum AK4]|uniref:Uncharacterized protein n=1 Tax=Caenispirillum salinarum AK4 TaxID=1238182 RepID=K9H444_9PROT|nr:hypothetical protein [Caenispirillum salinarum]EKV32342.1 hypothetical protein C882_2421 [Caenispirillum salinarum AK4]